MRRISLALALMSAVAAGCSGGGKSSSDTGAAPGVQEGTFTVTVQNNGVLAITGGKVTSTPAGIDCGEGVVPQVCSFDFPLGTTVTMTATAFVPNKLLGWAGDCQGDASCELTGNADKYLVVTFGEEGDRTGHPNWTDPVLHAGKYNDFKNGLSGALQCTACHGSQLQGQGIAPKCNLCHAMPAAPAPALTVPAGGVAGYVVSKAGPVVGAKVYLVPTGDVLADSIYSPPEWKDPSPATYAAGALVSHLEGVWQAKQATAVAPPALDQWNVANADWQFIAVVHTPHAFSNRNSYQPGDLVIVANTAAGAGGEAINTVFSVYESLVDQKGTTDTTTPFWSTFTATATALPPATATGSTTAWEYIGPAADLAYFDNLPAYAAKTYKAGALVRDANAIYRTPAGGTSAAGGRAADGLGWTSLGTLKALAVASNVDEPLEGTIREHGYAFATTLADGSYSFTAAELPPTWTGRYYLTVVPTDSVNLPGGDKCRKPLVAATQVVDNQVNVEVATKPSASASYVGPTKCLTCHSAQHNTKTTAHMLGIQKVFSPSGLQDLSKFPNWNVTNAKFSAGDATQGGTTLYFYGVNATFDAWTVSEVNPGANVSFTARLYKNGAKYFVELNNIKNPADPLSGSDYEVELSYGGGIQKQRYVTKVKADGTPGGAADVASRFIIPIQFNYEGVASAGEASVNNSRYTWQHYNGKDWFSESAATASIRVIPTANPHKSFDSMCAGCHFTGYSLANNLASAAADVNGDYDYDADGDLDVMNVSCESCHGPGSEHVAAGSQSARIVNPSLLTPEREVAICSQCHTRFVGNGGTLTTAAALATEAPLSSAGKMPQPGISRKEFLQNHVSKIDDGMWDAKKGNGKYSVKHHQQASDFLTTEKYRNHGIPKGGWSVVAGKEGLGTCSSCHDLHGNTTAPRQLVAPLEMKVGTATTAGLCTTCHAKNLGGTGHTARGAPSTGTTSHTNVTTWTCASCHVPKTAKSGSGAVAGTVGGETFYRGDISSHLFIGVPYVYYAAPAKLPTSAKTGSTDAVGKVDIMPIPYTDACGSCHTQGRANWKDGFTQ